MAAEKKPHHFTVAMQMNSYSEGELNQTVEFAVTEYAKTGAELTLKEMTFTKEGIPGMLQGVIHGFDVMSQPYQQVGIAEAAEQFEKETGYTFGEDGQPKKKGGGKK